MAGGDLAAHPEPRRHRESAYKSASRYVSPWAAAELIRRGIITRALFLASTTKPDRFLRRLEREGIGVQAEGGSELVRAYRFVVPEGAAATKG